VADYAQVKRGAFAAVEVAVWQDLSAHSLGPIGDALTTLLDAGKADGIIRSDIDARDVIPFRTVYQRYIEKFRGGDLGPGRTVRRMALSWMRCSRSRS
jgi:hypothetical protein